MKFNAYSTADVTDDLLSDCKRCNEITKIIESYNFGDYYKPFTKNSKTYTCIRKDVHVLEPEIVFLSAFIFLFFFFPFLILFFSPFF